MRISDWSSDVCSSDLPLAAAGQFGRYARTSGMNFGADMMRDEADDAFAIGGAQPGAAIRDALAEPVDPEAAVRIEHDLDDLRVGKPTGDRRSECGLQHARAAISRFEPDRFCCHGRTPFRGAGPECPCDGAE